jgi:putative ABC transport system substrate-binding protein
MKKIISIALSLVLCLTCLCAFLGCESKKTTAEKIAAGETIKVGIIQFMSHPSLDNCYDGIIAGLDASGIKYEADLEIGSSASASDDCSSYARNMVAAGYDMIIAIATPAAVAAFTATADTDIPVIFCAVSDPVAAELVNSLETPGDNCTGTSDVLDLEAQVDLIQAMQPDVKTIGVLYTSSETNSLSNLANFKTICETRGLILISSAVQNSTEVPASAMNLASKVDCINNFTDNNVVNNLTSVLTAASTYKIPVYGSEVEQVKNGCLASVSIDYIALGKVTGEMAAEVLKGADASAMAVRTISDATPVINTDVLTELKINMPSAYADIAETVTTNK